MGLETASLTLSRAREAGVTPSAAVVVCDACTGISCPCESQSTSNAIALASLGAFCLMAALCYNLLRLA